ncbi:DinB family protein [Gemmatimonas sp.]|uniref:DinB family protein n=1 Tax=Gemmatimonas sp. TaxID=1962908 RepID=UPI0039831A0B
MPIEETESKPVRHPEYVYMDYARHLSGRLRRTITGPMWHGPSLREALQGLNAADAVERPIRSMKTVWEIVLHVTARAERARLRMDGMALEEPTPAEDWPRIPIPCTAAAWEDSQVRMANAYRSMAVRVCEVMSSGFLKVVEKQSYNIATMADGVAEHGAYHAGQIVILRREIISRRPNAATLTDLMW